MTLDGQLVVLHDTTVDLTTHGRGGQRGAWAVRIGSRASSPPEGYWLVDRVLAFRAWRSCLRTRRFWEIVSTGVRWAPA